VTDPVLDVTGVVKTYQGLRPLRLARLTLQPGEQVALLGFDAPAAEMLSSLITGALTPEAGVIRILGASTASIQNSDEWLALVDRIGVITERAVLLDGLTVLQNLALPFTISIDSLAADVRRRVEGLAEEAGLPPSTWDVLVGELDGEGRTRVRLGRAVALDPALLILEHPSAEVARDAVVPLARHIRTVAERRSAATLTLTADEAFARSVAPTTLTWRPADGTLHARKRGWLTWRG
jgi:ABC-type transporter Mla maintaining outer membrane lipid asymmetry ATPase subunit MlaF